MAFSSLDRILVPVMNDTGHESLNSHKMISGIWYSDIRSTCLHVCVYNDLVLGMYTLHSDLATRTDSYTMVSAVGQDTDTSHVRRTGALQRFLQGSS